MTEQTSLPCRNVYCRLPNLVKRSVKSDKPCRIIVTIPATDESKSTSILECPLCGSLFHKVNNEELKNELLNRGIPIEDLEALNWNVIPESAREILKTGSISQVNSIINSALKNRLEYIGKDITLLDGTTYFRDWYNLYCWTRNYSSILTVYFSMIVFASNFSHISIAIS